MKKIIYLFIFISILLFGCSQSTNMFLGVGQALDSQAPKINITSPENGVYINKSDVTITGICSDNVGVARIRAEAGINETASVVTEEVKFSSVRESSWSVTFKESDLERVLKLWRSGLKVTFTFTCYDGAGNATVEHLFLYVDVELPTVIINRPEVRFTEDEKIMYEKNPESFKTDYDLNKFEKINSFVNKDFIIKGYVDDDYSVKSTYVNIYNATKKKQVAVTPVIFKDGTFVAGGNGIHGGVTGNSQSWEFKLDSTLFCQTEGWYVLEVVTEDDAGNEKRQFVGKDWIYINQAADIPRNNFTSFSPGFKLNAGNMIAGNGFDDDGMKEVWIKIVPKDDANPDIPYTEWKECENANYIVKRCADFAVGGQLGNWSLNVPSKAGEYIIYAVPVDITDVAPQTPYEGIYTSYFSVASEEDPVVGIDGQFRGATIVEEEDITGFFYDNEKVTKITAKMKFDDREEGEPIVLYDSSKSESENLIIIDKRENFSLMTGQVVVKHFFTWNFKASNYPAFKILQITLRAEDEDDYYGEDAVTIYGDSERPSFVGEISPANNSDVKATNIFKGTVSDNVGVVKVIIKNENNENGWECKVSTPEKVDNNRYESTFESNEISPNDFGGYIDSEFTITAIDAAGNEANHIVFLKGDKNKAQIEFYDENGEKQKSGSYVTKDKTFDIRITPPHFADGTYKEISKVFYSLDGKTETALTLGSYSEGHYSVPLKVETLVSVLGENYSGDVTLQIKAIDKTDNESPGTLYFIVDNEAPNALSITSPILRDKDFITDLTDDIADINENDISYYQNEEMTLKGTISDNYKISKTILDFYNADGTSKIHSVTLTYGENGKLSVSGDKSIITASSGIPGNFTLKIDTTKFDDGSYLLKTTAYDAAGNCTSWGNEKTEDYYFKVLQDADIPRIIFNVDFDSEWKTQIFPGTTLKGAVIDDDAIAENGVRYIISKNVKLNISDVEEKFATANNSDVKQLDNIKSFTRQNWEMKEFNNVGTYHLYMVVKDNKGDKTGIESKIYERTVVVKSTDSPFIEKITVDKGTGGEDENRGYYSGNINIVVSAKGGAYGLKNIMFRITKDSNENNSVPVEHNTPDEAFDFGTPANDDLSKWHRYTFKNQDESEKGNIKFSFDSSLFSEGKTDTIYIEVKCCNIEGEESMAFKEKIAIDNEGPTLKITSPVADASVNKKFDIQGSANDRGSGVDEVYVSYQKEPKEPASYEELMSDKWIKLTFDGISWDGKFDSEIIDKTSDKSDYNLTIAACDKLGNFSVLQQPIIIDQDGDRPNVRLQNLNLSSGSGKYLHKSGFIYGTISDDDGEVKSIKISEDNGNTWSDNCYNNGSWEYTFNGDGEKTLKFQIIDSEGTEFTSAITSGLDVPKIIDSTGNKKTDSIFNIIVDTESPEMTDVYFNAKPNEISAIPTSKNSIDNSVWSNSFSGKTFGGIEKVMWFLIGGTDENGIGKCELTTKDSGVTITKDEPKTIEDTSFYRYKIDIANVTLSSLNFKIVMEDNSGLTTQKSFTVNIDNTAPTVNISSHNNGDNVYGTETNTIKGNVDESESKVEYALTVGSVPNAGDYIEIGTLTNWEIVFNKYTNNLNSKLKTLYSIPPSDTLDFPKDTYDLYVWLKATDKYGNVSEPTKIKLVVLANGDKPKVNIDYPETSKDYNSDLNVLGGRITISGSTEIATRSVKEVYIQIDTNYNGTFASDWESKLSNNVPGEDLKNKVVTAVGSVKGIPVTSSSKTNWRLNINENKTMEGVMAVKAIAVSETGKYTESEVVVFKIDKNVPQFSDLLLVQYDGENPVKTLEYKDETWLSGNGWQLECVIEDNSDVNPDTIKKDGVSVTDKTQLNDGRHGYKVKIPLETSGFGKLQFKLEAEDTSIPSSSNSQSFVLNYDNTAPGFDVKELSKDSGNKTTIENYSGVYTIEGTFNEDSAGGYNQSGFERIAMYFTRTVGGKTYVIDPMLKKGTGTENRYEAGLTKVDGMYWRMADISTIKDDKITLTSGVPGNVRKGGLVKVGGVIYRINDISGQQIAVAGSPATIADKKAYFAIAQVIDNMTIESGKTTYYDDNNSLGYDDGDKMVEGVYRSGTSYEWTVSINSENILDGDTDIHFLAFDKAGNVTPLDCYGSVSNNTPRIAGVTFAMDNNINGTIEENEKQTGFANIYNATVTEDDGCIKGVTVNGKLPNGNKVTKLTLPLESSETLMTIKGKTRITAKLVGGNSGLSWRWKIDGYSWSALKELSPEHSEGDVLRADLDMEISQVDFLQASLSAGKTINEKDKKLQIEIWDKTEGKTPGTDSKCATVNILVDTGLFDTTAPKVDITPFYWNSESDNSLYQNSRTNGHIELEGDLTQTIINTLGNDPKVSGKITISGTASDNVLVNALYMTIKGFKNGAEFKVAERDGNGVWKSLGTMDSDSWACEILNDEFTKDSNNINWKFHWDTSKVAGVAQKDVVVKARVEDKGKAGLNGDTVVYNDVKSSSDTYKMDVVPYIKVVSRGKEHNTNRAKSGAVPMLRGQWSNRIEGFNLGGENSIVTVVLTEEEDGSGNKSDITSISNSSSSLTTFQVPDTARDGYLSITVNGIRSINNINSNSPAYNREGNEYQSETAYWTDDRYIRVWQNYDTDYFPGSKFPIFPSMAIGNTGDLYASFANYSDSTVYYSKRVTSNPANSSAIKVFKSYDPSEETDICVSGPGTINVLISANYHNGQDKHWVVKANDAGGLYVYDSEAASKACGSGSWNVNKLELFYHNKMLQQFKNIRVKRSNTDEDGLIHTAYYDRVTSSIHYSNAPGKNSQGADHNEYSWVNIDGGSDKDDDNTGNISEYYDGKSIILSGVYESGAERGTGTGEHVGLALTATKHYPVVIYYDASKKMLKLARATQENPKGNSSYWKVQKITDQQLGVSVESIACEIDAGGYLHIAIQNGKNQLVYIKSTNNPEGSSDTAYNFEAPVVVAEGASWVDLTLFGSTPYISYISGANSYDGMNLAFIDSNIDTNFDGAKDGAWETMVAPLAYKVTSIRSCVEVHPKMKESTWEAAVGFTPGDLYRYALYIGSGAGH